MKIPFHKYHGTGNDFILIDNREAIVAPEQTEWFTALCHRRFGVGADGLILLNTHPDFDFEMDYYNSDGRRSSMCGNGGRCIVQFAQDLGIIENEAHFIAIDGEHRAWIVPEGISLEMIEPYGWKTYENGDAWLHTGSPHYVHTCDTGLQEMNLISFAHEIRYGEEFRAEGTNVNVVTKAENGFEMRTYERGVEDETWACGTGAVAVAEFLRRTLEQVPDRIELSVKGGKLAVERPNGGLPRLIGPAEWVFIGVLDTDRPPRME